MFENYHLTKEETNKIRKKSIIYAIIFGLSGGFIILVLAIIFYDFFKNHPLISSAIAGIIAIITIFIFGFFWSSMIKKDVIDQRE